MDLRRRVVGAVPEPALRAVARARHGELPTARPGRWARPGSALVVDRFDAHALRQEIVTAVLAALRAAGVAHRRSADRVDVADVRAARQAVAALPGPGWQARDRRVWRQVAAPSGALLAGPELACRLAVRPAAELAAPVAELPPADRLREPVDLVYTWVDGTDPAWQARRARFAGPGHGRHPQAANPARYLSRDELRYSLRSAAMFASWARRIHVVTDAQVPPWLAAEHPQIHLVDHREIFTDPTALPVFNSHAIESQLHHIPGLAEHYVYLNDDVFFGRIVEPELFFHGNGLAKFFPSTETIAPGRVTDADNPPMAAAKRHRALIEAEFAVTVTHKFQHGAHPQLRSVVEQLEKRYPGEFERTARSRLRHGDDLSVAASLHHHVAYLTGRATPGRVDYVYQDIGLPSTPRRLDAILRRRPQVFCLNDLDSSPAQVAAQAGELRDFFAAYFPLPGPYERPGS